jgi:hypothetical protein
MPGLTRDWYLTSGFAASLAKKGTNFIWIVQIIYGKSAPRRACLREGGINTLIFVFFSWKALKERKHFLYLQTKL